MPCSGNDSRRSGGDPPALWNRFDPARSAPPQPADDDWGLAPLDDEPKPAAKPVTAKPPTTPAAAKLPPILNKPPIAATTRDADDDEATFGLAPLPSLDELPTAESVDPLGTPPSSAKSKNPYLSPQTGMVRRDATRSAAVTGSLPIGETLREFFQLYARSLDRSLMIGGIVAAVGLVYGFFVWGVFKAIMEYQISNKTYWSPETMEALVDGTKFITALLYFWILKGLVHYGISVGAVSPTTRRTPW
ncbi:MAG: hypothetical protein QM811_15560 [Pirellulales bacterium]